VQGRVSGAPSTWTSVLDADRSRAALRIAYDVAHRAVDATRTAEALALARQQTQFPLSVNWSPYSLANGDAGVALMCSYFQQHQPGSQWDVIGHEHLLSGARALERTPTLEPGLFGGLSGFAFAIAALSRDGDRYRRLLSAVDDELQPSVASMIVELRQHSAGIGVGTFDIVSGLAGIAAYLLRHDRHGQLPQVLAALVWLLESTGGPPRWATPPEWLEAGMRIQYPAGNLNCGLAHGIPGPLAVLALAMRSGHHVTGQADVMRRTAEWLIDQRFDAEWGPSWPTAAPMTGSTDPVARANTRDAWCYGSPGVARALWLVGEALEEDSMRAAALDGIVAVLRRPIANRGIDSPTFCHGVAGLLQIVLRFVHDTGRADLVEGAYRLVDQLIAAYRPDRPLGYASLEPGAVQVDRPGLLDGPPGVAMTLLAAASDVEPAWDRMFVLS
jgi:lantibiotic biosynthesis protein